ncbi:MAG TPA: TetR family transcriptional regulator [Streptosporangiales bacterium]
MSTADDARPAGLRERKKAQTRAALSWAAVRLAVERGLENVRVDDIAAEVGVSARTFNNYFSSKGEAIAARHLDRARRIEAELRARPADEPLWDALTAAVLAPFAPVPGTETRTGTDEQWTAGARLMVTEPALQHELVRASAAGEDALAEAIAERTGTDAGRDLYPRLVAAAVGAAIRTCTQQWLRDDRPEPLAPLLGEAMGRLAAGLPPPIHH